MHQVVPVSRTINAHALTQPITFFSFFFFFCTPITEPSLVSSIFYKSQRFFCLFINHCSKDFFHKPNFIWPILITTLETGLRSQTYQCFEHWSCISHYMYLQIQSYFQCCQCYEYTVLIFIVSVSQCKAAPAVTQPSPIQCFFIPT